MASASGTLLKYFKQPTKVPVAEEDPQPIECVVLDEPTSSAAISTKRKNEPLCCEPEVGKRRKLSLSNIRAKQKKIISPMLPKCDESDSEIAATSPTASAESNQSNQSSQMDKENNYRSVMDVLLKRDVQMKNNNGRKSVSISSSGSSSPVEDTVDRSLVGKVNECLNLTSESDSPPCERKQKKVNVIESETDDEPTEQMDETGRDSDINIVSSKEAKAQENESQNQCEPADDSSRNRRSSRVKKPVYRFTIECSSDDEAPSRISKRSNKTPKKKNSRLNKETDEIMVIDDGPKTSRRSVSSVLGAKGKKKVEAVPVRGNSTSAMQEAKKLMESRAGHVHVTAPRAETTVTLSASSRKTTIEEVVWPTISHTGSNHIIIYPFSELKLLDEPSDGTNLADNSQEHSQFRYCLDPHISSSSKESDKGYEDCIDDICKRANSSNWTPDSVESLVDKYRICAKEVQTTDLPTDVKQWENRPWSQIYNPTDYHDYLGNKSSVKQLYRWLEGWKTKLLKEKKKRRNRYDTSSDSDSDFADGEEDYRWLDNVVLITGPSGSGKSGAIATCAHQLGYKIHEMDASNERSGKNVGEAFNEACRSHSVSGKSGSADFTRIMADIAAKNNTKEKAKKSGLDNFFGKKGSDKVRSSDPVIDVDAKPVSRKKKKSEGKKSESSDKGKLKMKKVNKLGPNSLLTDDATSSKVERMSLIVLEEIDLVFPGDQGFYAAIIALTQIAKRPIILTSNDPNITLPTDAEFLTLRFSPPKFESVQVNMESLMLSVYNTAPTYQLQQYSQRHNYNTLHLLSNLEFLNMSSPKQHIHKIDLLRHFTGVPLGNQRIFLEQTQTLGLDFVYMNLEKLLKTEEREVGVREAVGRQLVCSDAFVSLDMMRGNSICAEFQLFPTRVSSALSETTHLHDHPGDELLCCRSGIEDQLIRFLGLPSIQDTNSRINTHKQKDLRRFGAIKEVQRNSDSAISETGIFSRSVLDEFSALRQICRSEKVRDEAKAKRRFLHYLEKYVSVKDRDMWSDYWLGHGS